MRSSHQRARAAGMAAKCGKFWDMGKRGPGLSEVANPSILNRGPLKTVVSDRTIQRVCKQKLLQDPS